MTTLTALATTRTFFAPGPLRRGFLLGFGGALIVGLMLLIGASAGVAISYAERVMPGVSVNGVNVGGLDRAAAAARLEQQLPSLTSGQALVVVDGTTVRLPYAETGRAYQIDSMLDAAFGVARSGNPLTDGVARLRVLTHSSPVRPAVAEADAVVVASLVAGVVDRFSLDPIDARVTYDPSAGFVVSPAVEGATLDRELLSAELSALVASSTTDDMTITLSTQPVAPAVSTREATAAAIAARWMASTPLTMEGGGQSFELSAANLAGAIRFGIWAPGYIATVDEAAISALVEPLAAQVRAEPKDASFTWGAAGIVGVVPGTPGQELNLAGSVQSAVDALTTRAAGSAQPTAALAVTTTQPALSTEAATAAVSKMRQISTWTTFYQPGESNYWGANISIPANDLDGYVLAPGEWFSFWNGIGPVTTSRGYGYGGVIINGRSYPTGALAGGICSTSTTLFNAAMRAGLEIGERVNHSYYIERYPVGLDATVLKTDTSTTDMTFRNDTENPIVIRSYTGNGFVRFDLWGVSDGRTVSLSAPVTSNHMGARDTTVVNRNLRPGTSRRVESPHDGFNSVVTRTVRDADGDVLWNNTWVSHYRVVNGIVEVGPSRPRPANPPDDPPNDPPNDDD